MDYKLTFEDGSEILCHHGVKGMKWGVRNSETLAKYRGMLDAVKGMMAQQSGGGIMDPEQAGNGVVQDTIDAIKARIEEAKKLLNGEQEAEAKQNHDEQVASLAQEVIRGDWGNGEERYNRLQDSGYSYSEVQTKVNDVVYGTDDYSKGINTSGREDRDKD